MGLASLHTGPVKTSGPMDVKDGEVRQHPTIDGNFDRVGLGVDAQYGTDRDMEVALSELEASGSGIKLAGDVVPSHTGFGADMLLAVLGEPLQRDLYQCTTLPLTLCRAVARASPCLHEYQLGDLGMYGVWSVGPTELTDLMNRGIIQGDGARVIFADMGKRSNWNVTAPLSIVETEGEIEGDDGLLFFTYFKPLQPALRWLSLSGAAGRLIRGDIAHSVLTRQTALLRFDANGFNGLEPNPPADCPEATGASGTGTHLGWLWSESHPLAQHVSEGIAMFTRSLGAASFQELNLKAEDTKAFMGRGPDLSLDFVTRPLWLLPALLGDTGVYTAALHRLADVGIDPRRTIRQLQNHDELTFELIDFRRDETLPLPSSTPNAVTFDHSDSGVKRAMQDVRAETRHFVLSLVAENSYILRSSCNGVASTLPTLFACMHAQRMHPKDRAGRRSAVGSIKDETDSDSETLRANVTRDHKLVTALLSLQPGVMALSGWDLVGALSLQWPRSMSQQEGENKPFFAVNDMPGATVLDMPQALDTEEEEEGPALPEDVFPVIPSALCTDGDYRIMNRGRHALQSSATDTVDPAACAMPPIPQCSSLYGAVDTQLSAKGEGVQPYAACARDLLGLRRVLGVPQGCMSLPLSHGSVSIPSTPSGVPMLEAFEACTYPHLSTGCSTIVWGVIGSNGIVSLCAFNFGFDCSASVSVPVSTVLDAFKDPLVTPRMKREQTDALAEVSALDTAALTHTPLYAGSVGSGSVIEVSLPPRAFEVIVIGQAGGVDRDSVWAQVHSQ
ncbi:hypothetical protein KIPB_008457 [Kipferlia bialata]|uniref:Uncharacterized protein n=1 Tax=Kipferlia bialata TaxID=797122 RepID=A0A9K3GKR7_9EUKA|nr:hypothetical protein KIPB_008457 [Kipferlia bialata]|eukprot:g8457.t1